MHPVSILLIAITIVLVGILVLRLHAFLALLLAALTVALLTPRIELEAYASRQVEQGNWTEKRANSYLSATPADRVAEGFGNTAQSIGLLIAMASIIGKCLLDSGAADRIVRSTLRMVGLPRAPLAFLSSGFLLAIPVFFDTVFYLMVPLGKALWMRMRKSYVLIVLSIVAGATMAHSLVPPTPGPLFVAMSLNVDLLTMILAGSLVGLIASASGYAFACWIDKRLDIPLRDSAEVTLADLEKIAQRSDESLPRLSLSLLPIVLPIVLIGLATGIDTYLDDFDAHQQPAWASVLTTIGDKNIALTLSAAIALGTLAWQRRSWRETIAPAVQSALTGAGMIILITSAGGAFGTVVRQCGVADQIARLGDQVPAVWILPIAWGVTALVRSAQGSATVAMITAVGILEPLANSGALGVHPVYLALAIGCGSKPIAWMADSGFWVILKMSGLTEAEGLKTVTPMTAIMGVVGLFTTMLGAALWPLM